MGGVSTFVITVCAILLCVTNDVVCDCKDDFPSPLPELLNLKEGSEAGTLLWNTTYDVKLASLPKGWGEILEVANYILYLKKDFKLDGPDNENLCSMTTKDIQFKVVCNDDDTKARDVYIEVKLTDDFEPKFTNDSYTVHFSEENQIGYRVILFKNAETVSDEDCGQQSYTYNIEESEVSRLFKKSKVSDGYEILADSRFDYETRQHYILNISVTSKLLNVNIGKKGYTQLHVIIDDVDDRDPVFTSPVYYLTVPEETSLRAMWFECDPPIKAYDGDTGINTEIIYNITNNYQNLDIDITQSNGSLKINSVLDRENTTTYQVTIKAMQENKTYKSTLAVVIIYVKDVNDHLPQFSSTSQNIVLQEDAMIGTFVTSLYLVDLDEGENAKNRLSISSDDSSAFALKRQKDGGDVWLVLNDTNALKGKSEAHLSIHATPLTPLVDISCDFVTSCVTNITITILATDTQGPKFTKDFYSFTVLQPHAGQNIGKISTTSQREVSYNIKSLSQQKECFNNFDIDSQTGDITMTKELKMSSVCLFSVSGCHDTTDGMNRLCSIASVSINVKEISSTYSIDILENVPKGTVIFELPIQNLTLESSDFIIKDNQLVTNAVLDRETAAYYNLSLTKNNRIISIVELQIMDVNDNAPVADYSVYNITLTGLEGGGTELVTVKASDTDESFNKDLSYSLLNNREWLTIGRKTGNVTLITLPLDVGDGGEVTVFVSIEDGGNPPLLAVTKLQITLTSNNAEAFLILPITRDEIIQQKNTITDSISSLIGHPVTLLKVEPLGDVAIIGSKVYLKSYSQDGTDISSAALKKLLKQHAQEIFEKFQEEKDDYSLYRQLFIIAASLFGFTLFILIIMCIYQQKIIKRNKQKLNIMEALSKDTKIYDEIGKEDFTALKNEGKNGSVSVRYDNSMDLEFTNPAFINDECDNNNAYSNVETAHNNNESNEMSNKQTKSNSVHQMKAGDKSPMANCSLKTSNENGSSKPANGMYESTPSKPFVSTINIEKSEGNKKNNYENVQAATSDYSPSHSLASSRGIHDKTLDSDSGFKSDREGHEEEETEKSSRLNKDESKGGESKSHQEIPEEPEPDYAKKVHFKEQSVNNQPHSLQNGSASQRQNIEPVGSTVNEFSPAIPNSHDGNIVITAL